MQHTKLRPGDLVFFNRDTIDDSRVPRVIPVNQAPIGIVLGVVTKKIGTNDETAAYMSFIKVRWSDDKWNDSKGFSEENERDLKVIQKSNTYYR